jgi:hypothetical protein
MSAFADLIGKDFSGQTDIIPVLLRAVHVVVNNIRIREVSAAEELTGLSIPEPAEI